MRTALVIVAVCLAGCGGGSGGHDDPAILVWSDEPRESAVATAVGMGNTAQLLEEVSSVEYDVYHLNTGQHETLSFADYESLWRAILDTIIEDYGKVDIVIATSTLPPNHDAGHGRVLHYNQILRALAVEYELRLQDVAAGDDDVDALLIELVEGL